MRLRRTWFQHPWTFINGLIQFTIDPNNVLSTGADFLCCAQQQAKDVNTREPSFSSSAGLTQRQTGRQAHGTQQEEDDDKLHGSSGRTDGRTAESVPGHRRLIQRERKKGRRGGSDVNSLSAPSVVHLTLTYQPNIYTHARTHMHSGVGAVNLTEVNAFTLKTLKIPLTF